MVIEGPKASGKTETARRVATSEVFLDVDARARRALDIDPALVLQGGRPRLIDEWQEAPVLWNHVRRAVDAAGSPGQFILTGSATPQDDPSRHTGAGRFSFLRMRPMALCESGWSDATVSLAALLDGHSPRVAGVAPSLTDLAGWVTRGGWPAQQGTPLVAAARAARDYLRQIVRVDVRRVDGVARDPSRVARLAASLGRTVATEVRNTTLAADAGGADGPLSQHTVADYLDALDRLMVIEDQPAWAPHVRSKAVLRGAPKRHFVCPSLAVAATNAGPAHLTSDLEWFGQVFESLVVRDLRVLSQALDGRVLHYRDSYGLEVDAIVTLADGRWAAFEVKLGAGRIDAAAEQLNRFAATIDTSKVGAPTCLAVICGITEFAYRRDDGVCVIPTTMLGP